MRVWRSPISVTSRKESKTRALQKGKMPLNDQLLSKTCCQFPLRKTAARLKVLRKERTASLLDVESVAADRARFCRYGEANESFDTLLSGNPSAYILDGP